MNLGSTIDLIARARRLLGWGARAIDIRPLFFGDDVLPQFAGAAGGCEVLDTNGRRYIDWFGGSCNLLGYREPRVEEAIRRQLAEGPLLPFVHPLEIDVAERLVAMIPCAEMVAFGKNGSDGLTAAVRIARMVTGRDVILHYGYHGFHDWFAARDYEGIPAALRELVHRFPYNDLGALRTLLERFRVAAIVMEPVREELPLPGYLAAVKQLAHDAGALLVFDEVITALRFGRGGAQEAFGVVPDLACLGKCLGNGMPLSAIVGPRALLRHHPRTGVGMTFQGETLSLAAARAVLDIVRDEPVPERIVAAGEALRAGFERAAKERGIEASMSGHPARLQLRFADRGAFPGDYLMGVFLTEALRRGVVTGPAVFPSYAHDEAAVAKTIDVFAEALAFVARAAEGRFRGWALPGEPDVVGYVDRVEDGVVSGWILVDGAAAEALSAKTGDGVAVAIEATYRQDVAETYPGAGNAAASGFAATLPPGETSLILTARRGHAVARCAVEWRAATLPLKLEQGRVSSSL